MAKINKLQQHKHRDFFRLSTSLNFVLEFLFVPVQKTYPIFFKKPLSFVRKAFLGKTIILAEFFSKSALIYLFSREILQSQYRAILTDCAVGKFTYVIKSTRIDVVKY